MRPTSPLPSGFSAFRPLRHRAYAGLWSAGLVSNIGTWMESVAVGVLITETTGQAAWTGLIAALAFLPNGIFGPIGGALADRMDRRRLLMVLTAGQGLLAALLAVMAALGAAEPIPVAVIMLLSGCFTALRIPGWQSLLPDVVPREDLSGAISLNIAQFNLGRVVGPALAGLVIATGGYAWAFAANALSFGATLIAVGLVTIPTREPGRGSFARHIVEGFSHSVRDPGIATSVALIAAVGILASPFIALVPAVATFVFGGGTVETATLVTAQGLGAIAAAVITTPLVDRFGRRQVVVGALVGLPIALGAYAMAPAFPLAVGAIFLVGGLYLVVLSGLNTVVQLRAGPELRGRALSFFMLALGTAYPIGAIIQGAIADRVGLRLTTAVAAAALLAGFLLLRARRPARIASLDQDPAEYERA